MSDWDYSNKSPSWRYTFEEQFDMIHKYHTNDVACTECGAVVKRRNLHVHKNSVDCKIVVNHREAQNAGYVQLSDHSWVTNRAWSTPFIKMFDTGHPTSPPYGITAKPRPQAWALRWWLDLFYLTARSYPPGEEFDQCMRKIRDLYVDGNQEELDNLIGGLELIMSTI